MSEGAAPQEAPAGSATLVLVRHGESRWNAAGILQGQRCEGLSELGYAQSDAVADYLVKAHGDARFIARSDIDRVAQTAAPSEERLGVEVLVEPRLREIDLGSWSGRPRAEVLAAHGEELLAWLRCDEGVRGGGGETLVELRDRVWAAMNDLARRLADEGGGTALLFTHGGPVRTTTGAVLGLPPGAERRIQPVRNGSVTVVRRDPGGSDGADGHEWRLVAYNRADHLP